jgi:hypothetical protein
MKYILHSGHIHSQNDGERHFISCNQLARLYGVDLRDCVCYPERQFGRLGWQDPPGAIHLYPRSDGNYTIPNDAKLAKGK